MSINIALLGAGRMGQLHYQNLLKIPEVNLCYVYDPFLNSSHAQRFDEKLLATDLSVILKDKSLQACIIATPSTTHVEYVQTCAEHGKDIFCEKPISFDLKILARLQSLVEKSGIKLQVGFNRRFDPGFAKIAELVADNSIGKIHLLKITNRDPKRPDLNFVKDSGGLFFDFNIHDFDALKFITGLSITEVHAVGDALIQPELKKFNDIDTALISLKLSNGAFAIIDCSRETGYGYDQRLEVFGERGMLSLPNSTTTSVVTMKNGGQQSEAIPYSFVERFATSYFNELRAFFKCIKENKRPLPDINDAMKALQVARAAQTSFNNGCSVRVTDD
jgi:myo-inositol 2-dehydrogenase/D-chiro-inositol 1-dehydrogenase